MPDIETAIDHEAERKTALDQLRVTVNRAKAGLATPQEIVQLPVQDQLSMAADQRVDADRVRLNQQKAGLLPGTQTPPQGQAVDTGGLARTRPVEATGQPFGHLGEAARGVMQWDAARQTLLENSPPDATTNPLYLDMLRKASEESGAANTRYNETYGQPAAEPAQPQEAEWRSPSGQTWGELVAKYRKPVEPLEPSRPQIGVGYGPVPKPPPKAEPETLGDLIGKVQENNDKVALKALLDNKAGPDGRKWALRHVEAQFVSEQTNALAGVREAGATARQQTGIEARKEMQQKSLDMQDVIFQARQVHQAKADEVAADERTYKHATGEPKDKMDAEANVMNKSRFEMSQLQTQLNAIRKLRHEIIKQDIDAQTKAPRHDYIAEVYEREKAKFADWEAKKARYDKASADYDKLKEQIGAEPSTGDYGGEVGGKSTGLGGATTQPGGATKKPGATTQAVPGTQTVPTAPPAAYRIVGQKYRSRDGKVGIWHEDGWELQ